MNRAEVVWHVVTTPMLGIVCAFIVGCGVAAAVEWVRTR